MELMDQGILAAVEAAYHFGFPADAGAVLIVEVDGPAAGLAEKQRQIEEFCRGCHAREVLRADARRAGLVVEVPQDGRGGLGPAQPQLHSPGRRRAAHETARGDAHGDGDCRPARRADCERGPRGDGNVHPMLLCDERDREQVQRVLAASRDVLQACLAAGGSVTAEHGVGVEKIDFMCRQFAPPDLAAMQACVWPSIRWAC